MSENEEEVVKTGDKEQDLVAQIKNRWEYYKKRYAPFLDRAENDFDFYRGDQWDGELKEALEKKGRPALVKNRIAPRVELMTGHQREHRYYFKVIPGDLVPEEQKAQLEEVCKRYTAKLKEVENESDGEYELTDCFKDGVVCGRSSLQAYIDVDKSNIRQDKRVRFKHRTYRQGFSDPDDLTYDLSQSKDYFVLGDYSKDDLKTMFPGKSKLIDTLNRHEDEMEQGDDGKQHLDYPNENKDNDTSHEKRDLILKEYWYFEYEKKKQLLSNTLTDPVDVTENAKQVKEMYEKRASLDPNLKFDIRDVVIKTLYVCSYVSGHILERKPYVEMPDELPFADYMPNRVKSYNEIEKRCRGLVHQMKIPQEELNKRESQMLAHLNQSVGSGFFHEESAMDPNEAKKLEEYGSTPGINVTLKDGGLQKIERMEPVNLSQGHAILAEKWDDEFNKLTNIHSDLLGAKGETKSGRAIDLRINQGLKGILTYFDNFRRTKHILCKKLLKMLCYLDGVDYKQLKVVIDDTIQSPTARYANLQEMQEIIEMGALTPGNPYGDLMVDLSNLSNKEELKQRIEEFSEFQQWKMQRQQEAELAEKEAAEITAIEDVIRENEGLPT